jgi:class 3 adenylate cyclase/predicted ATPase
MQLSKAANDLAEWLSKHGLGQYAQTFAEHNIEYSVLPELTETDLVHLGLSLGHRRTLLKAIESLAGETRAEASAASASNIPIESMGSSRRAAEFRHITVLFCDLVESTRLSERLEPEDLQILIAAYREACNAAITRYGGWVARYMGDGVMAFFGWPHAHEDDAIRAVHAALEIVSEITNIVGPVTLAARVGVSSGPVVVGEIGGNGDTSVDAVGETPNIAARLQSLAAHNTVLISETTSRLLAGAFDCQDLGHHELKGISKRVPVYRVVAAKALTSRFDAAHTDTLTPLVGRSTELSMLLDRWRKSKEGDGQIILLSGLPGVGKSRLIHELKSQIQAEAHFLLNHQCSPYHSQSAFFPIIEQIERAAQIVPREPDAEKLVKLEAYLPTMPGDHVGATSLIADLLSISNEDQKQFADLTPQQIKNKTVSALVDMVLAFSSELPTLCIFEDVHWIDPSTLELLELTISRVDRARILVVVSYRPEFRPSWFNRANVTVHSLTRLSRSEVAGMVEAICLRERRLLQPVLNQIIEKADGLPLFIEELTNSILTSMRSRVADNALAPASEPGTLKVPDTLYDALMERLDRVPQGRRLAQTAAVIGREFSYELLSLAMRIDENDLRLTLARLEDADIIYRVGISPLVLFAFKHALLRDAIYSSLLKSGRRQMHADIAAVLETHFQEFTETQPEILAYHHSEAGNHELAVHTWYKSGRRAVAHSANVEAIAHFRKALDSLAALPDSSQRTDQEIELQLALGIPLIAVRGYAAEETREAFARARALCLDRDSPDEYFQALYGLWGHSWMSGKNDEALNMANEFLSKAQTSTDPVPVMVAHRVMGSTLLSIGQFQRSRRHFEESIALSKMEAEQSLYSRYMVEPQAASLLLLSWDLWALGYPAQSLSRVSEALALAQKLAQPYTIAFANYMASVVHLLRGEADRALACAETSLEISREQRFSLYVLLSRISRGRALGGLGHLETAKTEIQTGLDDMRSKGVGYMLPMMDSWLAEMFAQSGENETALAIVEKSLAAINDVMGRSWEAELHRLRAEIVLALDATRQGQAELYLGKAIEVSKSQSAKSLELRAVTSLASILNAQGRNEEARNRIGPVYGWFSEGADTQDLRRARDVLMAVSG